MEELAGLLDFAVAVSREAGDLLSQHDVLHPMKHVKLKGRRDPVTDADLASERLIVKRIRERMPEAGIWAEEEVREKKIQDKIWFIDPLDGTVNFSQAHPFYAVSIALYDAEGPVLGVVHAPVPDILWYGDDNGSFKQVNNEQVKQISVSSESSNNPIRVIISRSHLSPGIESFLEQFNSHELMRMGSSIKMCLIADGSADIYPRLGPTMEWDTAASHAIVNNAGGSIKSIETGDDLVYNKKDLHNPWFVVNSSFEYRV